MCNFVQTRERQIVSNSKYHIFVSPGPLAANFEFDSSVSVSMSAHILRYSLMPSLPSIVGLQLADMPSPLPRKPAKQKRLRSAVGDQTPNGPTPKKRGTRMRALTSEGGTPKGSRSKTALGDSSFSENVVAEAESVKPVSQSEGRLTRCIDLSARGTWCFDTEIWF